MDIGKKIRKHRKAAGLTQEQVAGYLGVSAPAVNKWERGSNYPDISVLPALARLFHTDLNEWKALRCTAGSPEKRPRGRWENGISMHFCRRSDK